MKVRKHKKTRPIFEVTAHDSTVGAVVWCMYRRKADGRIKRLGNGYFMADESFNLIDAMERAGFEIKRGSAL